MKIIVITGALGYIGTELCKLYSGWKYEVIATDNRFISERVNELKRRKIKFIQALKEKSPSIIGCGAPARATTALNFFDEIKKNNSKLSNNFTSIKSLEK